MKLLESRSCVGALACVASVFVCTPAAGGTVSAGAPRQEGSRDASIRPAIDPVVGRGLAQLCEDLDGGATAPDDRVLDELLQYPSRLANGLASALLERSWSAGVATGAEPTVWRVTSTREALLRELAGNLEVGLLVERSRDALAREIDDGRCRVELMLLAEVARAPQVSLLIDLAAASDSSRAGRELERALTATLRRDGGACREVDAGWEQIPGALRMHVLRALAESGRPEALPVVAARLDDQPRQTLAVLSLLGRLGSRSLAEPNEYIAAAVRAHLDSSRADVRREAALVAGRLEVSACVPRLVEMLESSELGERDAAHWALRQISLLGLPPDPGPWKLWLQSEEQWRANVLPGCIDALWSNDPALVIGALDQMARQRYRRSELALVITSIADSSAGDLTERRCHALGALRSRASLPFLRARLDSPDECVSAAAASAWQATTGRPAALTDAELADAGPH